MTILNIALIVGITYWIIGVSGSWKRAFWLIFFSLIAFIIAFQYSDAVLELMTNDSLYYNKSNYTNSALSFLLFFGVVFIILIVLHHILWDNKQHKKGDNQPGLINFAQSILTSLVGWSVGAVFAIAITVYISGRPGILSLQKDGISAFFQLSANLMINIGKLFSVNKLPAFLIAWVT